MAKPTVERVPAALADAVALLAACGALIALSRALAFAPCWALVFLVIAVALPIGFGRRQYALIRHRLTLDAVATPTGRVRRWFWPGRLTSALQWLSAAAWAALLLALAALLDARHLALLAVDAALLAFAAVHARALLRAEIRGDVVGLLSRRWLLMAGNLVFLAAAFFVLDYFFVGAPRTQGMAWNVVAELAYEEQRAAAACPLAGMTLGALNAAERLNWHVAQELIPRLPDARLNVVAWLFFLAKAGAVAWAYTALLLGVLAWTEQRRSGAPLIGRTGFPAVLAAATAAYLLGAYALRGFDPAPLAPAARALVASLDPCRSEQRALKRSADAEFDRHQHAARLAVDRRIEDELDRLFAGAEAGVDRYLDWYFSLLGEYQRLAAWIGAAAASRIAGRSGASIDEIVLERSLAVLQDKLFSDDVDERLSALQASLAAEVEHAMAGAGSAIGERLRPAAGAGACGLSVALPGDFDLRRDALRASGAAAAGIAAPIAARAVAARALGSGASRLASMPALRSSGSVAARLTAKRAGALLLPLAACSAGGAAAVACAGVAWIAVDAGLVRIDELRFRQAMREELLAAVQAQRAELADGLRAVHHAHVEAMAEAIRDSMDRVFIPARHGTAAAKPAG